MSIPVEIGDLEGALADFGSGYLLTTHDGRVKGYTLLVDGTGAADGEDVRVQPETAVLHRPRSHADLIRESIDGATDI